MKFKDELMNNDVKEIMTNVNKTFADDLPDLIVGITAGVATTGEQIIRVFKTEDGKVDWEFETRWSIKELDCE